MQLAVKCILQVNYILLLKAYLLTFMLHSIIIYSYGSLCGARATSVRPACPSCNNLMISAERLHMHVTHLVSKIPPLPSYNFYLHGGSIPCASPTLGLPCIYMIVRAEHRWGQGSIGTAWYHGWSWLPIAIKLKEQGQASSSCCNCLQIH